VLERSDPKTNNHEPKDDEYGSVQWTI